MGGSDQWGNITAGIDLIRRTPRPAGPRPHLAAADPGRRRQDGQVGRRRGLARPRQDQPVPVPPVLDPDRRRAGRRYLLHLSLRPLDEIEALLEAHAAAPERRLAQRALADELTELVHGPQAATAAAAAAEVLFGGDPTTASAEALAVVAREVPDHRGRRPTRLNDLVELLVRTGLASSNGDARRGLAQAAFGANGRKLGADDAARRW